jgi:hypothetical protein
VAFRYGEILTRLISNDTQGGQFMAQRDPAQ